MPEHKRRFLHRWFEEVWNQGNEAAIDELVDDDAEIEGLGAEPIKGPEGFKPFYRDFRSKFSDINVTVDDTYVDGDTGIAKCTVKAVHTETGKPVTFSGTSISVIKDGKIRAGSNHFDFLSMYMQAGKIMPEQLA